MPQEPLAHTPESLLLAVLGAVPLPPEFREVAEAHPDLAARILMVTASPIRGLHTLYLSSALGQKGMEQVVEIAERVPEKGCPKENFAALAA